MFDSQWELDVYTYCKDNGIEVEYTPRIKFKYESNGRRYTYHPDFRITGKLYEVKGDHFFTDDGKMFCPYCKKDWTFERWVIECEKYEAK